MFQICPIFQGWQCHPCPYVIPTMVAPPLIVEQAVQQVNTLPEALAKPPEVFEQLLDAGPKCSSFRFLFDF